MLTCKEATRLASKAMDAKLTWHERVGLSLHLLICVLCRRYVEDLKQLRVILRRIEPSNDQFVPHSIRLSSLSRERIKKTLNNVSKQNK